MGFRTVNDIVDESEDYGRSYYVGVVTNNQDPLGIGRVQANVPGLYDTTTGEVPWIGPNKDSPFGFGTSAKGAYGVFGSPQVGSEIKVELQNGDENHPLYTTLPSARHANPAFKDPLNWGFQDPEGNILLVNMQSGTWRFTHFSGAFAQYDASAHLTTSTAQEDRTVSGAFNLTVGGGVNVQVTGNVNVNASGNAVVSVGGNISLSAGGTATYHASAHIFTGGPVTSDNSISAAGNITDLTASGNVRTVGNMREFYDIHTHQIVGVQGGNDTKTTNAPNQPI